MGDFEDLIATRDHRAYAGSSMGSITGFEAIRGGCADQIGRNRELFSGFVGPGDKVDRDGAAQKPVDKKNGEFDSYAIGYWYNGTGTGKLRRLIMWKAMASYRRRALPSCRRREDLSRGDNCIMADKPGKGHACNGWIVDLYNALNVFIKK